MSRSSRRSLSLAMLAIVGLFVAEPVLTGWHNLTQPHYWCPEHGTLEHVQGDQLVRETHATWYDAWESSTPPLPVPQEHVRCLHQQLLLERAWAEPGVDGQLVTPLTRIEVCPPVAQRPWVSQRRLDDAPKQSPPV